MRFNPSSLLLISIFKNVIKDKTVELFITFLKLLKENDNFEIILKSYTDFIISLYETNENQNIYLHVRKLIFTDENIISKGCVDCAKLNDFLLSTAEYELTLISELTSIDFNVVQKTFKEKFPNSDEITDHLPVFKNDGAKSFDINEITTEYQKNGYGIFSCYKAFKYTEEGEIIPIKRIDDISFKDLKNYEYQKNVIKENTLAFLNNKKANNILLYGDRGCGKSSSVKALLNEFNEYNLKMIQVYKGGFVTLPELYEKIGNMPLKFIIFADDISFSEDDTNFSSIKANLEGSLCNKPDNVLIYATTNRIHLVKETFSAREGNDVHFNDTIDETVSLSDRFGIILTYSSLNKNEYLDIVKKIANDCCVEFNDELAKKSVAFSIQKGIMTPRVARQFINDILSNIEY